MTKEDIIENGTATHCSPVLAAIQYKQQYIALDDVRVSVGSAMDEYAQQQAIAFAIHYATGAIKSGNTTFGNVNGDRMDVRYQMFLKLQSEQQNKEQ